MELIILLLPIILALLLSFKLMFFSKNKTLAFRILGAYFLLLTLVLSATLLQYKSSFLPQIKTIKPIYSIVFYGTILSLAPTVYFYIASLTDRINNYNKIEKVLPHYLIPITLLLVNLFSYMYVGLETQPSENTSELVKKITYMTNFVGLLYLFPLLSIFYVIKAFYIYIQHKRKVNQVFSYDEGINLKWMLIFLSGYVFYVISFIVLEPNSSPYFVYIPMLLYLVFIGFIGAKQKKISVKQVIEESGDNAVNEVDKGGFSEEKRAQLKQHVLNYLANNEPYLDPQLTIYQFAKLMGTNSNYLSVVLNKDFNQSFTEFINTHRVQKAIELFKIAEHDNYTVEAIGNMSGFKSKSVFNRWFKDITGETPSYHRRKLKSTS